MDALFFLVFVFLAPQVFALWPQPQQIVSTGVKYAIDPNTFTFVVTGAVDPEKCLLIKDAIARYQDLTFLHDCSKLGCADLKQPQWTSGILSHLPNLTIRINHKCEDMPHEDMDEMYTIRVGYEDSPNSAFLFANNIWGAIRGLETFSQLVLPPSEKENYFSIGGTFILDYPRFTHRGILLDTSRHFLPLKVIYNNLDAMAYNKMNVFHWHIVDDQSFPFVSKTFPQLSEQGAFNPQTHIYTPKDVSDVIEYARLRGIRVMVEFDTPGHTKSWGKGNPDLLTPCYNVSSSQPDGSFGPINPLPKSNYEFLKKLFTEVAEVFPEQYIHLGGDEVDFNCWKTNPDILKFMKQQKFETFEELESYYIQQVIEIVGNLKKSYMVWEEVFDNHVKIKNDTVVHVWLGRDTSEWGIKLLNITSLGYRAILSSPWYLNIVSYNPDWKKIYVQDPVPLEASEKQAKLILGGEACQWGEFTDGSNMIPKTWPRASAVAERLWSSRSVNKTDAATLARIRDQQCRMQMRGLRVEPIDGPAACKCDYCLA